MFHSENDFEDNEVERTKRQISMIAISKIEEFASMLDDSIDTSALEKVPFEQRFPIGMYAFTYLDGMDISYQVMVYDSTKESYEQLMESLPELFSSYGLEDEEYLSNEMLEELEEQCRSTYFCGNMVPPYEKRDIINILKYYAQKEEAPEFYTFDDIDTRRLDPSVIAKHIYDEDMGERRRNEYINSLWESNDDNLLRLFFGRKIYFLKQVQLELMKISHPDVFEEEHNVVFGKRNFEDMALCEIGKVAPEVEKELRDKAFERAKNSKGLYECAACKMTSHNRIPFQIDHIIPLNKGGKTVAENLQVLCRKCNASKSDKVINI